MCSQEAKACVVVFKSDTHGAFIPWHASKTCLHEESRSKWSKTSGVCSPCERSLQHYGSLPWVRFSLVPEAQCQPAIEFRIWVTVRILGWLCIPVHFWAEHNWIFSLGDGPKCPRFSFPIPVCVQINNELRWKEDNGHTFSRDPSALFAVRSVARSPGNPG